METVIPGTLLELVRESLPSRPPLMQAIEKMAKQEHIPIVAPEVGNLLSLLVEITGAKRILEIGTAVGYSALWIAQAMPDGGLLTTIEIDEDRIQTARRNFAAMGLEDRVHSIAGDAVEVLPHLQPAFDMIFLDAAKGQYPNFFPDCIRLLREGGVLVVDNVLFGGMVLEEGEPERKKRTIVKNLQSFLKQVTHHPALKTSIIPLGDGLTFSIKR